MKPAVLDRTPGSVDVDRGPAAIPPVAEPPPGAGRKVSLNRVDQISAVIWFALGLLVVLNGRHLGYLAQFGPGPGFLPFWVGLAMVLLGVALFVKSVARPSDEVVDLPAAHPLMQMALVMASLAAFAFFAERLGFILCIFALFLFILIVVERRSIPTSVLTSIIAAGLFWWVFEYMLQMRLPPGLLRLVL